jgi:hypothetical protein
VKPFFAGNYNVLIEAMRFNQTQVAWFSAKPALEAVDRAQGEVIARIVDPEGRDSYTSTLIVRKGSGITLDKVLACGKQYDFGIGDAQSTSASPAQTTRFRSSSRMFTRARPCSRSAHRPPWISSMDTHTRRPRPRYASDASARKTSRATSSCRPAIVCVLPLPVCPYASTVPRPRRSNA